MADSKKAVIPKNSYHTLSLATQAELDGWNDMGLGKFEPGYLRDKEKHEVDFIPAHTEAHIIENTGSRPAPMRWSPPPSNSASQCAMMEMLTTIE